MCVTLFLYLPFWLPLAFHINLYIACGTPFFHCFLTAAFFSFCLLPCPFGIATNLKNALKVATPTRKTEFQAEEARGRISPYK